MKIRTSNKGEAIPSAKWITFYKYPLFSLLFFFGLFGWTTVSWPADWYVAKGKCSSSCDGTTWGKAWDEMNQIDWSTISVGDTIWLAGGTYSTSLVPGKSGTPNKRINIRRIRATDPVCLSPCDATYDTQVVLSNGAYIGWTSGIDQLGSYVTVDGRMDSGIRATGGDSDWGAAVAINTRATGLVIQNVEMVGPCDNIHIPKGDAHCLYMVTNFGRGSIPSDITIRYCRIHGAVNLVTMYADNVTFEYNWMYENWPTNVGLYHSNVIYTDSSTGSNIFRFNEVHRWINEGILITGGVQIWKVYGNVWYNTIPVIARCMDVQYGTHDVFFIITQ